MSRPSFVTTIKALREDDSRFDWVRPTEDESEVADLLEELEAHHVPTADEPDERGRYGRCAGCLAPWPCDAWAYGEELALQWLGRGADRYAAHGRTALDEPSTATATGRGAA